MDKDRNSSFSIDRKRNLAVFGSWWNNFLGRCWATKANTLRAHTVGLLKQISYLGSRCPLYIEIHGTTRFGDPGLGFGVIKMCNWEAALCTSQPIGGEVMYRMLGHSPVFPELPIDISPFQTSDTTGMTWFLLWWQEVFQQQQGTLKKTKVYYL